MDCLKMYLERQEIKQGEYLMRQGVPPPALTCLPSFTNCIAARAAGEGTRYFSNRG